MSDTAIFISGALAGATTGCLITKLYRDRLRAAWRRRKARQRRIDREHIKTILAIKQVPLRSIREIAASPPGPVNILTDTAALRIARTKVRKVRTTRMYRLRQRATATSRWMRTDVAPQIPKAAHSIARRYLG